jgi:hypothetical protein
LATVFTGPLVTRKLFLTKTELVPDQLLELVKRELILYKQLLKVPSHAQQAGGSAEFSQIQTTVEIPNKV